VTVETFPENYLLIGLDTSQKSKVKTYFHQSTLDLTGYLEFSLDTSQKSKVKTYFHQVRFNLPGIERLARSILNVISCI